MRVCAVHPLERSKTAPRPQSQAQGFAAHAAPVTPGQPACRRAVFGGVTHLPSSRAATGGSVQRRAAAAIHPAANMMLASARSIRMPCVHPSAAPSAHPAAIAACVGEGGAPWRALTIAKPFKRPQARFASNTDARDGLVLCTTRYACTCGPHGAYPTSVVTGARRTTPGHLISTCRTRWGALQIADALPPFLAGSHSTSQLIHVKHTHAAQNNDENPERVEAAY